MRRLALTIALACVLSIGTRAGEIPTTGVVATPTPSPTTTAGEIPSTGVPTPVEIHTTGVVTTIILTVISIVP